MKRFDSVVQEICDDLEQITKRLREAARQVRPHLFDVPAGETLVLCPRGPHQTAAPASSPQSTPHWPCSAQVDDAQPAAGLAAGLAAAQVADARAVGHARMQIWRDLLHKVVAPTFPESDKQICWRDLLHKVAAPTSLQQSTTHWPCSAQVAEADAADPAGHAAGHASGQAAGHASATLKVHAP